ncbi:MAG: protein kinase, partial [Planctomycetaceae bacterium]|nr:protein kinase [Planctomycetaceae bacterium]
MDHASLQFEQALDEFEQAWQTDNNTPDIQPFLEQVPEQSRSRLLAELVPIDLEYRWKRFGQQHAVGNVAGLPKRPHLQDYAQRFGALFPDGQIQSELIAEEQRLLKRFGNPVPFDQINELCQTVIYRDQMDSPSQFQDCLDQVSSEAQPSLMRNLLHAEIDRRRDQGEQPELQEYLDRFPDHSAVVQRVFGEAATVSNLAAEHSTSVPPTNTRVPVAKHLGEYRLLRELGRGGMGCVYEAVHLQHQHRVALKTLPSVDGPSLHRFKQEFRLAAELNHPNLIGLHTLQADGGQWFLTMDLVEGTDFQSYVRPNDQLDLNRLRKGFAQLASATQALHSQGIVHRDIKPGNVMVSAEGRVLLLDFGLAIDVNPSAEGQIEIGGTPAYMAPEQVDADSTTAASDWYAVGVMLYQALTGELPFTGSVPQILAAKQSESPPAIQADVPSDLADLCLGLLAGDPVQRPGESAILEVLSSSDSPVSTAPTLFTPTEHLIGREQNQQELERAFESFQNQTEPRTIFIGGRSGEGKTVLAEQFLQRFRNRSDCVLLSGRCYDRETVPFKALDRLIDALGTRLGMMSFGEVQNFITPDTKILAELFPVLNRVEAIARLPRVNLDELEADRVRNLAVGALKHLLIQLSQQNTLVLFIDDLQWGDADSAELLWKVLQPPYAPRLMLVGTFRSDEKQASRFLQTWETARENMGDRLKQTDCELKPFSLEQSIELVIEIVGENNETVQKRAKEIAEETSGNPFLIAELASCFDPQAGTSQPMHIEEVVARKLTQLPPEARRLLDVVTVSGQALSFGEASHTAGHATVPLSTITRMRTERLLRVVGDVDNPFLDTYHDRIRETVLRDMEPTTRKSLHIQLAEEIESQVAALSQSGAVTETANPRIYDLAFHFYEGTDPRAFDYQLRAGETALGSYATEAAMDHLGKAKELLPENADSPTRFRLWSRMGEGSDRLQQLPEAIEFYQKAMPHASSAFERGLTIDATGEMYHRLGELDRALEAFDKANQELGYRRANWAPQIFLEINWGTIRCFLPWFVRKRKTIEGQREADLASNIFHHIAQVFLIRGDSVRYSDTCIRLAIAAIQSCHPACLAFAYSKLGMNYVSFSLKSPARWMFNRSNKYRDQCLYLLAREELPFTATGPFPIEAAQGIIGIGKYMVGSLKEGEKILVDSLQVIQRLGGSWIRTSYIHMLRHVYSAMGRSEKALATAQAEYQSAQADRDPDGMCWGLYGMADAYARMGEVNEAQARMADSLKHIEGRECYLTESIAYNHAGFVYLQSSDYAKAIEALDHSKSIMEKRFYYADFQIRTYALRRQ